MAAKRSPFSVTRKTRLPARNIAPFSCRLPTSGEFQWKRKPGCPSVGSGRSLLSCPLPRCIRWT
ncbi:MAG TPA: hypothetical protein PKA62_10600 [Thermoanaerobaculia bacterium]|nr:hypothetical protein [Thermoanaerobaculia bacterium]